MKAFSRAAVLTSYIFSSKEHRDFIMGKIFEASFIEDEDIVLSTTDALNEIARVSYDYMREYIDKLGDLTHRLIQS